MRQLNDYSDSRNQAPCIHCGEGLHHGIASGDHVPTRALLDRPYPDNLPTVDVCGECNNGFSKDENYLVALIACVISGSLELTRHDFPVAAGILARSAELADRIERTRRVQLTLWGDPEVEWSIEPDRVANVVVKNARGHALYELRRAAARRAQACSLFTSTPDVRWSEGSHGVLLSMTCGQRRAAG